MASEGVPSELCGMFWGVIFGGSHVFGVYWCFFLEMVLSACVVCVSKAVVGERIVCVGCLWEAVLGGCVLCVRCLLGAVLSGCCELGG